jgi:hypothetical protein
LLRRLVSADIVGTAADCICSGGTSYVSNAHSRGSGLRIG